MKMMYKLYRLLIVIQGLYSLLTAVWGLVHIDSFMLVTGPKYDIWLVKTVSVLLVAISICLLSFLVVRSHPLPAILLGGLTALGLASIDIYYTSIDRIKWVYGLDASAQVIFVLGWLLLLFKMDTINRQLNA